MLRTDVVSAGVVRHKSSGTAYHAARDEAGAVVQAVEIPPGARFFVECDQRPVGYDWFGHSRWVRDATDYLRLHKRSGCKREHAIRELP